MQFALTFRSAHGVFSQHESDWSVTAFNVLDLTTEGKHEVTSVIEREVGRIECNGFIEGGEGIGAFTFKLSRKYLESMRSHGHGDADEGEQFVMAVHDLNVDFARTLKSENVYDTETNKVVAFERFDGLRAKGFNDMDILQPYSIDIAKSAGSIAPLRRSRDGA